MDRKVCRDLVRFIETGNLSDPSYESHSNPFFIGNPVKTGEIGFNTLEINNLLQEIPIKGKLKIIYQILGNKDIELYKGIDNKWTFLKLETVQFYYDMYKKNNQFRSIDFAKTYHGLGHYIVVSFDPQTCKIYYKIAGGSCGISADANFKLACEYIPQESHLFDFSHFEKIINENTDVDSIPRAI
tara:strand:- start:294 stop:848 length:555 start_codon:yes stop_codon:yes gene_type:complete